MRRKVSPVLLAGLMLVFGFLAIGSIVPSAVAAPLGGKAKGVMTPTDLPNAIQDLQEQARQAGVTISNLRFKVNMGSGTGGIQANATQSCTVSATVGVPGVGSVTISVTADTCAEAVAELAGAIAGLMQ